MTRGRAATRGFTLIEVVVAVAILATALGAVISGMARYASNAGDLRERTLGLWVAHNELTELMLAESWPNIGRSDGQADMAGTEWRWDMAVSKTEDPALRRVEVRVYHGDREAVAAELTGFIASTGRNSP